MELALPCTQQFKLRPGSHEPFNGVEHLLKVRVVRGNHGRANKRPPMLVLQPGFSGRDIETPPELGHEGPYKGALFLEAMHIAQ